MELDQKDKKILAELQKNSDQSMRQLGTKLSLPAATVHNRIKKLEENEVIKKHSVILDADKVGLPSLGYTLIRCKGDAVEMSKRLAKLPGVLETHILTGRYDLILKVRGKSEKELGYTAAHNIKDMEDVISTETFVVVYTAKETGKLDIRPVD